MSTTIGFLDNARRHSRTRRRFFAADRIRGDLHDLCHGPEFSNLPASNWGGFRSSGKLLIFLRIPQLKAPAWPGAFVCRYLSDRLAVLCGVVRGVLVVVLSGICQDKGVSPKKMPIVRFCRDGPRPAAGLATVSKALSSRLFAHFRAALGNFWILRKSGERHLAGRPRTIWRGVSWAGRADARACSPAVRPLVDAFPARGRRPELNNSTPRDEVAPSLIRKSDHRGPSPTLGWRNAQFLSRLRGK